MSVLSILLLYDIVITDSPTLIQCDVLLAWLHTSELHFFSFFLIDLESPNLCVEN